MKVWVEEEDSVSFHLSEEYVVGLPYEMPEELVERYKRAYAEWEAVQIEIRRYYK